MTRAPSHPEPTTAADAPEQTDSRSLLSHAVEEVARLLQADGAMVYLVDDGMMRFAVDAGIRNPEAQQLIRDLTLPIGVGIFGHAAATAELVVSGDYRRDRRFPHSPVADRIVQVANMRSMAAAPLLADGEVLGALGAYSSRIDAFDEAGLALLRALADHAAAAIANQRLIERLARSQAELARRVDTQRTLGEIAARIAVIREPEVVLQKVVDAARRLIGSDAAHLTLMLPGGKLLRPTVVVGGNAAWTEDWLAQLEFPVDGGINGLAAGSGEAVWTEDYLVNPRIPHDETDQEVARRLQLRGMAAAPLRGPEGEVIGTLAVSFERQHAFGADELELLQGLADQGAIAIANARLTEDLRQHGDELAHRVDAQRTLAEMAAQLTSLRDPSAVLIQTLNAAVRLLKGRGGQIGMVVTDADGVLRWGDGHSLVHGRLVPFTKEDQTKVDDGVSGRAVREGRVSWTDDYLPDTSFPHDPASDRVARKLGIRAVIAAPLIGEGGPVGAIGVYAEEPSAFDADDGELLGLLAGQAVIVLTNARLNAEAEVSAAKLAHRVEAQRTLGEIAASITSLRDPSAVLRRTIDEARRLLAADHVVIHQVRPGSRELADYREVFSPGPDETSPEAVTVNIGQGIAGRAIEERTVTWTGDYLADRSFQHTELADEWIGRFAYRSQMSAPLIGEEGPIGAISAYSTRPDAFDADDSQLLGTLASQAAIVLGNARLYEELERRIEAQRSLGAIAARITAIRDPGDVLQRTLDEAVRLLDADGGRIELVAEGGGLHWAFGHSAIDLPIERQAGEADVSAEEGVSGRAVQERRVVLTGDYLADESFVHAEAPDRYIRQHGIRSVMSAPLIAEEGAIGSLTVHSPAREAFDASDAELLEVLASQAAIAVTNTRLYAEVEDSERRYRHLVDNSPDIVWSVDADGRFTFFSDSLESRTGWKPEQLLGQPFTSLAGEQTLAGAAAAWDALRADPEREQRVRLDLPLPDGRIAQTEVAMTGTMVDGRFAGAHGSVRDISERERLEGDLRGQAAELAASQERAHLARELHDSVTQALFSMGLTLRTLELLLPTDPKAANEKVAELRELQKDALAEMRTLIFELRPTSLESDGLVQALRTHATAVQRRTGLAIVVDAEPIERLPISTEEALYRIGQEALHNVVKHANASHATIRIVREGDRVRLSVTDDGAGFQPGEVPRGHLGLIGMRQRVDLVGGELRVESKPGRGTVVEASVPGDEEPPAE